MEGIAKMIYLLGKYCFRSFRITDRVWVDNENKFMYDVVGEPAEFSISAILNDIDDPQNPNVKRVPSQLAKLNDIYGLNENGRLIEFFITSSVGWLDVQHIPDFEDEESLKLWQALNN